jgi:hypothetical protein
VVADVAELAHKPVPARSPAADHPITATLKARVEALQVELAKVEASAGRHRADFERERERADRLMTELLRATRCGGPARRLTGGPADAAVVASHGGQWAR